MLITSLDVESFSVSVFYNSAEFYTTVIKVKPIHTVRRSLEVNNQLEDKQAKAILNFTETAERLSCSLYCAKRAEAFHSRPQ
jgi:hypothetical protein